MKLLYTPAIQAIIMMIIVVVIIGTYLFIERNQYKEIDTIGIGVTSFTELADRFEALAKDKGGVYAFRVLRDATLPPHTDLHLLGHTVGEILYEQEGVDGIALCTNDFRNACSHTMVIGALADYGEGALPLIREACKAAPGGPGAYTMCFHGLGHGVTASVGYELSQTIAFCKKTGTSEYRDREYIECIGGAIMELAGGGGHDRDLWLAAREKYLTSPLSPCMDEVMPDEVKEICLTYLTPEIWKAANIDLQNPDPAQFTKAFAVCEDIPINEERLRHACFGGFGKEFVPIVGGRDIRNVETMTDEQFATAISWCNAAESPDGRAACISEGLASVFWGGENDPWQGIRFCSLVPDSISADACYARLALSINSFIRNTALKKKLCEALPENYETLCLKGFSNRLEPTL